MVLVFLCLMVGVGAYYGAYYAPMVLTWFIYKLMDEETLTKWGEPPTYKEALQQCWEVRRRNWHG